LLVIPGIAFGRKDTHIRISYAAPDEKLRQGVEILNRMAG
jgi:aspartate aminotransferase/aminotransferase